MRKKIVPLKGTRILEARSNSSENTIVAVPSRSQGAEQSSQSDDINDRIHGKYISGIFLRTFKASKTSKIAET